MQIEIHKDNLQRYIKSKLCKSDIYSIIGKNGEVLLVEITIQ